MSAKCDSASHLADVVAAQVDEHDVLRTLLRIQARRGEFRRAVENSSTSGRVVVNPSTSG
eukprot:1193776-Prorocentrum_minimum.AAC.1